MWPRFSSVTVTTGSRDVIINSGESASNIIASDALIIGNFQLEEIESVLAGADGKTVIRLFNPWLNNSLTQAAVVIPNPGDLRRARQALKDMEQLGIDTLVALNGIATSETKDFVTITDAAGTQYQVPTASFYQRKIATHEAALNQLYNDKKAALDTLIATNHLHARTEADMEAMRAEVERITAASGYMNLGNHAVNSTNHFAINQGLYTNLTTPNVLLMSRHIDGVGTSKTEFATTAIAGFVSKIVGINSTNAYNKNVIRFPEAPDGTITYDSETGIVTQHATSGDAFDFLTPNHDFRNGDSGWWAEQPSRGTVTYSNGQAIITDTAVDSLGMYIRLDIQLVAGTVYEAEFDIAATTGPIRNFIRDGDGLAVHYFESISTSGKASLTFTAGYTGTGYIILYAPANAGSTTYNYAFVKKASVDVVTDRVDLWGFEGYLEQVTPDKPYVYPNGLIQSQATIMDGIATSDSNRPVTYYAVFDGDTTSRGKGVNFFALSVIEQDVILNNPDNHIYRMRNGDIVQWRLRQRTIAGAGNGDWDNTATFGASGYLKAQVAYLKPQGAMDAPQSGSSLGVSTGGLYSSQSGAWGASFASKDPAIFTAVDAYNDSNGMVAAGYNGECYFLVGGTVPRLNQGAYDQQENSTGTKLWNRTDGAGGDYWHSSLVTTGTRAQAFNQTTVAGEIGARTPTCGIGQNSGRPDGRSHNSIGAGGLGGVIDDRLLAWDGSSPAKAAEVDAMVKAGKYRGKEKLKRTTVVEQLFNNYTGSGWVNGVYEFHNSRGRTISIFMGAGAGDPLKLFSDIPIGSYVQVGDNEYSKVVLNPTGRIELESSSANEAARVSWLRTEIAAGRRIKVVQTVETNISVSGEFVRIDVGGDPNDILQTPQLVRGWPGGWINTIPETGVTKDNKFTRKSLGLLSREYTVDNGGAWVHATSNPPNWSDTTNSYPFAEPTGIVLIFTYRAFAKQTEEAPNEAVLHHKAGLGDVWAGSYYDPAYGGLMGETLLGKPFTSNQTNQYQCLSLDKYVISANSGALHEHIDYITSHAELTLKAPANNSPAVKALTYQTSSNNQASLNYAFNELKHDGTDWGDNGQMVIEGNTSTYTNDNGETCLCGTAQLAMSYGWVKNEV